VPRSEIRLLPVFAALALLICCAVAAPFAEASGLVSYQGKLTDASGQAVSDGLYNLSFLVYPAATGGTPLWSETGRKVQVTGGCSRSFWARRTRFRRAGSPRMPGWRRGSRERR